MADDFERAMHDEALHKKPPHAVRVADFQDGARWGREYGQRECVETIKATKGLSDDYSVRL